MYIPKHFQVTDPQKLAAFIRENSFGTLFSQTDGVPFATHLPFLIEQDEDGDYYLLSHMARANPHWADIKDQVLVVFQGPHAYISPAWYQEENTVPTWNYTSVHVYGELIPAGPEELVRIMADTILHYEASSVTPWMTDLQSDFNEQMMKMVVGVKIKITRFEGKWKLSQNHSPERRKRVIEGLRQTKGSNAGNVADLMERALLENGKG